MTEAEAEERLREQTARAEAAAREAVELLEAGNARQAELNARLDRLCQRFAEDERRQETLLRWMVRPGWLAVLVTALAGGFAGAMLAALLQRALW